VLVLLVLVAVVLLYLPTPSTVAQNNSSNLKFLFERLDTTIVVKFVKPIVDVEPIWILPSSIAVEGEDTHILRSIAEIGDDYICINETAGGARKITCVPFSNIASVTYDNMD